MYLKKTPRPRVVRLPNGDLLSYADLPPCGPQRWMAQRKALVVYAVRFGLLSKDEACLRYDLSEEELGSWMRLEEKLGVLGLKATDHTGLRNMNKARP